MDRQTILIVGTSFHTLREYLLEHGLEFVTLKDARLTTHPEKRLKRRVVCDFSSKETMFAAVDEAAATYKIAGVLATYENYVVAAAEIAAYLGLPGMPVEAARACTDKSQMRAKFAAAADRISPAYQTVTGAQDLRTFAQAHGFPLILKPANLSKSLLVFKNHDLGELLRNYRRMTDSIERVYATYAPNVTPKILVEEFMEGPVHSVEAFVDDAGTPHILEQVVDYQTGYDIGYDDNFHYSRLIPSRLPEAEIRAIRQVAEAGCRTLGMKSSPAHIEIIHTTKGPRIVEIGARNGGYRERMHGLANGIDITGNAMALALGKQPDIQAARNDPLGVFELFPKMPGTFAGIENEEQLKALRSFNYLSVKAKPGVFVGKSSDGFKMCAVVILHSADAEQFARDKAFLDSKVKVITK